MQLTVVGCSPAWPNPGGAQSGYLVEGSGALLLDCGAGVLARLREREPWPRVDAIAITHFHLDHFGDLVPWVWGALFGPGRDVPRPELWLPPGGIAELEELGGHLGRREMFSLAFACREYADRQEFSTTGFRVTPIRMLHYDLVTFGFRVRKNGTVLGYSGDSGPCTALDEVGRDADVFVCEATLEDETKEKPDERGHLSADEAVAAFERSGAKRLLLTHRPRELPLKPGLEQVYDGFEIDL